MATSGDALLLGRLAVHYKLISMDQLNEATRQQGSEGGSPQLGQLLVDNGWIKPQQLIKLISIQKDLVARHRAAQAAERAAPAVDTATPGPPSAHAEGAKEASAAAAQSEATPARASAATVAANPESSPTLLELLRDAASSDASDVHIHSGARLRLRKNGEFVDRSETPLAAEQAESMLRAVLTDAQTHQFDEAGEIDFSYSVPAVGRFRVNLFRQQRGMDGVFRRIPEHPPSLESLGLPPALAKLTNYHHGMVLVTGPSGCGKSSTLAAFVNILNEEHRSHIITIEDPIETVHPSKRCLVNQRQVGPHTESFARALRAALREDPDVIAIGEIRDLETISLALTAAETGHFVLATLHTNNAIRTINRLVGAFPPDQQSQVRTMISESLRAVVCQRLVRTADGSSRVPALEVLVVNQAVGNLIRENKTFQIQSILQTGGAQGMRLLDDSLAELVRAGTITREEALLHCEEAKRIPQ